MAPPNIKINGTVDARFEPVLHQFKSNFSNGLEHYAQLCVYVDGKMVVDLWGGPDDCVGYNADTYTTIFSSTKCLTAICMALLVDRKLMNYTDAVIEHWPEYGNYDKEKEAMTVSHVLRHEGGMPNFSKTLKLEDIQTESIRNNSVGKVIEKESLVFPSRKLNTKAEYHALTRGWILNEIFRRVDPKHRTIGECLREDICAPLNVEAYIGLPEDKIPNSFNLSAKSLGEIIRSSMIPKVFGRKTEPSVMSLMKLLKVFGAAGRKAPPLEHMGGVSIENFIQQVEHPSVRKGEAPSVNGQCSARGLARIASMMANKGKLGDIRILSEDTWVKFHEGWEDNGKAMPPFPAMTMNFSQGGVNRFTSAPNAPLHLKTSSENRTGYYGWFGFGGSVFQWYPDLKIGFAYVPTLLAWEDMGNGRGALLQKIVLDCVRGTVESS